MYSSYYSPYYHHRPYYDYYYRPYYYDYYWPYRPYNDYYLYDSNYSDVNQNITNFGDMQDVYQNSYVNQIG